MQVDQREAELQPGNLAGEEQHLVQQRERQAVDQPHGQLAQQSAKSRARPALRAKRPPAAPAERRPRPTKTALARMGSAVEEKNGAKATIPLTRTRASVIALRKVVQSVILP